MQNNQPVTQRELELPADAVLMSTTDLQSRITYANRAFVEASGYSLDELRNQPHNIVRHPDMPPEAFGDMWATLKGGEPWTALVKNRRANGDHYWVRANAMPVHRDGQPAGYMSVRTAATRAEVAAAESLYADLREGRAAGRRFHKGLVVRGGLLGGWRRLMQTMPVRWRIRSALAASWALVVVGASALGLGGGALAGFAAMSALIGLTAAAWLDLQVSRPLESVRSLALGVASGASRSAVHLDRVDEIGMTLRTISQLGLMFRWIVDDVSQQVRSVQAATGEIAQGNDDLSTRTERAAASVQQTASSMEQMTSSVQSNAASAGEASRLSNAASDAAEQGGRAVAEVVRTMQAISESSRRIGHIIGTIDGIAFQTNILALNAAVEAARAGEQGRGFAVVAGEVRSLAQRSADSAREIKGLIGASVEQVEAGSRRVGEAGRTMDDIVQRVREVTELIAGISTATAEQSDGVAQVGQAIGQLDEVTQQNAALVEQSAAASASLRNQTDRLVDAVGIFR